MSISAGVTIQSLRIKGDATHKQTFLNSLDSQHWVAEESEEIIFIQKIEVSGYWWELAKKIADQANEATVKISQGSTTPANSVKFKSRAELVASIIQDLLANKREWYATLWLQQQAIEPTPLSLLTSKLLDLPWVLDYLEKRNLLIPLFQQLSTQDIRKLNESLCFFLGVKHLKPAGIFEVNKSRQTNYTLTTNQVRWLEKYFQLLSREHDQSERNSVLFDFVSVIGLWQWMPHKLQSTDFRRIWFDALSDCFMPNPSHLGIGESESKDGKISDKDSQLLTAKVQPVLIIANEKNSIESSSSQESFERNKETETGSLEWLTDFGRVFFLIHVLRQFNWNQNIETQEYSPWVFIYHLAKSVASEMGFALDAALASIFCALSKLDEAELNATYEQEDFKESVAKARIELKRKVQPFDLWNPDLILGRAKVQLNQAYLDIYFDKSKVQLNIRRAGLDIDPGWVPWLGCVVRFHYGNFSDLVKRAGEL